jgi:hypothetical protein
MPPVQKAFQIASICCLISPVSMVFTGGGWGYEIADWKSVWKREASASVATRLGQAATN